MEMFKIRIGVVFLLFSALVNTRGYSQEIKINTEVEEIIRLGKDVIVQLALNVIDERIRVRNFSQIKVMAGENKIYVLFRNPIKYLSIDSTYYFDVSVDLLEKTTSYYPVSNGVKVDNPPFFEPTEDTNTHIQFVIDAINKCDEVGSLNFENFEDDMTIREFENYYKINIVSAFQESIYKIEKVSGKIYDLQQAHLEPLPVEFEDRLKEIY